VWRAIVAFLPYGATFVGSRIQCRAGLAATLPVLDVGSGIECAAKPLKWTQNDETRENRRLVMSYPKCKARIGVGGPRGTYK
jgi:hypothetical protein